MEYQLAAAEEATIQALDFRIGQTSKHVQNRRSVAFYPTGAGVFSNRGVRVIRVSLTSENGWVDPSTLRLQFSVRNLATEEKAVVQPLGGPHVFFDRCRVFLGGALVEDVQSYARTAELMHRLSPTDYLWNESVEGFGLARADAQNRHGVRRKTCWIPSGERLTVLEKPALGLLMAKKHLPVRWCTMELEWYLAAPDQAVVRPGPIAEPTGGFRHTDEYEISNVKVLCDLIHLDNSLENAFAELMLKDRALTFSMPIYVTQHTAVTGDRAYFSLQRGFTRLNGLFINFCAPDDKEAVTFRYPGRPRADGGLVRFDRPLELQVAIGSKLYPEVPISSTAEFYEHLRKIIAHHDDKGSIDIDVAEYESDSFIVGVSTQKVIEGLFSGLNTRSGDLVTIRMSNFRDGADVDLVQKGFVTMVAEVIVEIRDSGVSCYD